MLGSQTMQGCLGMHPASTQMLVPPGPSLGREKEILGESRYILALVSDCSYKIGSQKSEEG
jgi:hypothetical protein